MVNVQREFQPLTLRDAIRHHEESMVSGLTDREIEARRILIDYEALDASEELQRRLYLCALMISDMQAWSDDEIDRMKAKCLI